MALGYEVELDVDELRCQLGEAREEFEALALELADATDEGRPTDARDAKANLRQVHATMRRLRTAIRVEEGCR